MSFLVSRVGAVVAVAAATMLSPARSGHAADLMPDFGAGFGSWITDRYEPASFSNIGSFAGRDNVLGIGIDSTTGSANRPAGQEVSYYSTQGRQFVVSGGAGSVISADLYVPMDWSDAALGARRTDAWGILATAGGSAYPIVGFSNEGGVARFRVWDADTESGWVDLTDQVKYEDWNTLSMEFTGTSIEFSINGTLAYTDLTLDDPTGFTGIIMQAYNFAEADNPGPVVNDYVATWSNTTVPEPASMALLGLGLAGLLGARSRRH